MKKCVYANVLIFIFLLIVPVINLKAVSYDSCSYTDISRLKSYVSNINISYDYYIQNNVAYYNVTISNIIPGIYFIDSQTNQRYNYTNTVDGEITLNGYNNTTGSYRFYSELDGCQGIKLGNKYYKFPIYNFFYEDDFCVENRMYSLCQKWVKKRYSYEDFEKLVKSHNKSDVDKVEGPEIESEISTTVFDNIINFYVKYYYIILGSIIVICVVAIIINSRKNKFDI